MFTVVSLFSGCGGSSLGYQMAGGKILLAVEWEDNAAATYKINFPNTALYHGDVCQLTNKEIFKITGLKKGELDLLDGSPPCQGFSTSGKREFSDDRNQLFKQYIRILKALEPRTFIMENVSGMIKGKMKLIFKEILLELKECGYDVKASLLNAKNYGVPQSRERIIFLGVRKDIHKAINFPHGKTRITTAKEAIEGAECSTLLEPNEKYISLMNKLKPGENLSKFKKGSFFSYGRLWKDRPSQTLTKSVSYGKVSLWHFNEPRNISIEEAKRLQSFPDDFKLIGSYQDQWARIGNSVPPLLSMALATQLKKEVFNGTSKRN